MSMKEDRKIDTSDKRFETYKEVFRLTLDNNMFNPDPRGTPYQDELNKNHEMWAAFREEIRLLGLDEDTVNTMTFAALWLALSAKKIADLRATDIERPEIKESLMESDTITQLLHRRGQLNASMSDAP